MTNNSPELDHVYDACPHARPQEDSQLHGICIFCWRDRLGAAVIKLRKVKKQEKALTEWLALPKLDGCVRRVLNAVKQGEGPAAYD